MIEWRPAHEALTTQLLVVEPEEGQLLFLRMLARTLEAPLLESAQPRLPLHAPELDAVDEDPPVHIPPVLAVTMPRMQLVDEEVVPYGHEGISRDLLTDCAQGLVRGEVPLAAVLPELVVGDLVEGPEYGAAVGVVGHYPSKVP